MAFNSTFRNIDDVLSTNDCYFNSYADSIYPWELEIKDTTQSESSVSYFDNLSEKDINGNLPANRYIKRDGFKFSIVNFPY